MGILQTTLQTALYPGRITVRWQNPSSQKKSTFVCLFVFHILNIQMNLTSSLNIEHSFLFLPPKAVIDGVFKMEEIQKLLFLVAPLNL